MNKLFVLIAIVSIMSLMISCDFDNLNSEETVKDSNGESFIVVEIEGCEYLKCKMYRGYNVLCHKGNCKNIIHKQ